MANKYIDALAVGMQTFGGNEDALENYQKRQDEAKLRQKNRQTGMKLGESMLEASRSDPENPFLRDVAENIGIPLTTGDILPADVEELIKPRQQLIGKRVEDQQEREQKALDAKADADRPLTHSERMRRFEIIAQTGIDPLAVNLEPPVPSEALAPSTIADSVIERGAKKAAAGRESAEEVGAKETAKLEARAKAEKPLEQKTEEASAVAEAKEVGKAQGQMQAADINKAIKVRQAELKNEEVRQREIIRQQARPLTESASNTVTAAQNVNGSIRELRAIDKKYPGTMVKGQLIPDALAGADVQTARLLLARIRSEYIVAKGGKQLTQTEITLVEQALPKLFRKNRVNQQALDQIEEVLGKAQLRTLGPVKAAQEKLVFRRNGAYYRVVDMDTDFTPIVERVE